MKTVLIIGAGEAGRALAKILNPAIAVDLWDKDQTKVPGQKSLQESVKNAEVIFLCVPSWNLREAISSVLPHAKNDAVFVSLSKGIEEKTLKIPAEILQESLTQDRLFAVLGGPMLAEEILRGLSASGVVGSAKNETLERISAVFGDSNFRIARSEDFIGVSWCGVLKNIYAVAFGIADGLNLGGNFKGKLFVDAVREMLALAQIFEYKQETVLGIAGAGDLLATAFSPHSRNRMVGEELAKTGKCCLESESAVSLPLLISLLGDKAESFSLLWALGRAVKEKDASEIVRG
jgi:glycerol-3-phosphate dehydrogenase (NAD(P)+)